MPENISEDRITGLELLTIAANRFNPPGDVTAEDRVLGLSSPAFRRTRNMSAVSRCQSAALTEVGLDFYQDFILLGRRFFYLFELKNIR